MDGSQSWIHAGHVFGCPVVGGSGPEVIVPQAYERPLSILDYDLDYDSSNHLQHAVPHVSRSGYPITAMDDPESWVDAEHILGSPVADDFGPDVGAYQAYEHPLPVSDYDSSHHPQHAVPHVSRPGYFEGESSNP